MIFTLLSSRGNSRTLLFGNIAGDTFDGSKKLLNTRRRRSLRACFGWTADILRFSRGCILETQSTDGSWQPSSEWNKMAKKLPNLALTNSGWRYGPPFIRRKVSCLLRPLFGKPLHFTNCEPDSSGGLDACMISKNTPVICRRH